MTPEGLRAQFDVMADAPNGVQKVRELVLQLAVRGKLAAQDAEDQGATEVRAHVDVSGDRDNVLSPRGTPRTAAFSALKELELPESWRSVRLGDVVEVQNGYAFDSDSFNEAAQGVPLIRIRDLAADRTSISYAGSFREEFLVWPGDYLIGMDGNFEVHKWRGERALLNQRVCRLRQFSPAVDRRFVFWVVRVALDEIHDATSFVTVKHLSSKSVESIRFPLPPLAEQRRIAAKVDELMALCDELELRQQRRAEARARANRSVLHHLVEASGDEEIAAAWDRLRDSFGVLYDVPETVAELRQGVMVLAVRGRLVPQDPNDELGSISHVRANATADTPYEVPAGWAWVHFGDVTTSIEAGWSPSCESRSRQGNEWGVLKISAVSWGLFDPEENKALPNGLTPRAEHEVRAGDFLMSRANTAELVGRSVLADAVPPRLLLNDKTLRVHVGSRIDPRYLNLFNNCPVARAYYASQASGTSSSMRNLSREQIRGLPVALPPLAEQQRILAKVNALLSLCDRLDAQLTHVRTRGTRLAESVVHHLTAA